MQFEICEDFSLQVWDIYCVSANWRWYHIVILYYIMNENMENPTNGLIREPLISTTFEKYDRIVIISHTNADGDAVGSLLGAFHILKHRFPEKEITTMLPNGCPRTFRYLPGSEGILSGEIDYEFCHEKLKEADLVLGVDFNNGPRVDMLEPFLVESKAVKVLIDHHHNPDRMLFDEVVSIADLSSACELVYRAFTNTWGKECMTREAAMCLYNGICTDTGSFSYSAENPSVYEVAAELVKFDINAAEIHNRIDNTFSIERMQFWGYAIHNLLTIERESRFAYFRIPSAEMEKFGVTGADLEGLVSYTLKMEEIEVGVLMREDCGAGNEPRIKISFRSKYDVDVNVIAQEFGGGGHTKAAGATCTGVTLEEIERRIRKKFVKA